MKKNRPTLSIQLTEPCNENWDAMPTTATGKFCQRCERDLIDFSRYSDRQLAEYLEQNNGKSCGRFRATQLDRNLLPEMHPAFTAQRLSLSALTLLATMLTAQSVSGQEMTTHIQLEQQALLRDRINNQTLPDAFKVRTIDGGVSVFSSDSSDLRIAIKVELFENGTVIRTRYTDFSGIFSVGVLPHEHPDHIRFSKTEYGDVKSSWHAIDDNMYDSFTSFSLEAESLLPPKTEMFILGNYGSRRSTRR